MIYNGIKNISSSEKIKFLFDKCCEVGYIAQADYRFPLTCNKLYY